MWTFRGSGVKFADAMPRRTDIHTILIIGSGPIVIGQGCEFDYSGVQACRALKEEVTFNRSRVTSLDWASYPIITFAEIPDEIDIVLIDRPDLPPMRVGEPASETVWPGVANAIYDAIGMRLRQLPFTPDRVLAELTRS